MLAEDMRAQGLAMRRKVLGDQYVEEALGNADDFTRPWQDFLNEHCWGSVWPRQGLSPKIRSMITLVALASTGKFTELKAHTRGALRNGCTPDEIREIFMHLAVYAGVPTAVEAFRAAQPVIASFAAEGAQK